MAHVRDILNRGRRPDGRFDLAALSAGEIAALEAGLTADPAAAAELARLRPTPDAVVQTLRTLESEIPAPPQEAWRAVWKSIDRVERPAAPLKSHKHPAILRFWRPVGAIAAGLALFAVWRSYSPQEVVPRNGWPVRLAQNVEFGDVESSDDVTPLLWSTEGPTGTSLIWLVEKEG